MTKQGGYDDTSHHLVRIHQPPNSLVELRKELAFHPDITIFAQEGKNFEECLGKIALKLDIALDGMYDVEPLCVMLVEALRNRRFFPNEPHKRAKGLISVEMIEKEGSITLQENDGNVVTILPEDAIITRSFAEESRRNSTSSIGNSESSPDTPPTNRRDTNETTERGDIPSPSSE